MDDHTLNYWSNNFRHAVFYYIAEHQLGSTLVRPAQPSAFPRYTFLSKTIRSMSETNRTAGTADFNYKIDDKFGAI